jgi:curved DNA-binding protein CbpA
MKMRDPYEELNLSRSQPLDPEIVRKAYKAAAAKAHPDRHGGSEERMAIINQARDILLNPERKKRFDDLGSTESGSPSTEEMAIQIIGNLFYSVVEKAPDYMTSAEIFVLIAQEVGAGRQKALEAQRSHPKRLKKARKLMNSIKCAPLMRRALDLRVAKLEREIAEINQQVELGNLMLKLMESVEFK